MPKITNNQETTIRRAIRDAYAIDPLIDGRTLLKYLEDKFKRSFSWQYIQRLVNKVDGAATIRIDKIKVETELRHISETVRINIETLTRISLGQSIGDRPIPTYMEMAAAARTIGQLKKLQLDAMIDLGVFDKALTPQPGEGLNARWRPIPDELLASMKETAKLWKMPSDLTAKIEAGAIITIESKEVPTKVELQPVPPKSAEKMPENHAITIRPNNGIEQVPEFKLV